MATESQIQASREELKMFYEEIAPLLGASSEPLKLPCTVDGSTVDVEVSRLETYNTIKICFSTIPDIVHRYHIEDHGIVCVRDQLVGEEEGKSDAELIAREASTRRYFDPRLLSQAILEAILETLRPRSLIAEIAALGEESLAAAS